MESISCKLSLLGRRHYVQRVGEAAERVVRNVSMLGLGENEVCEVSGVRSVYVLSIYLSCRSGPKGHGSSGMVFLHDQVPSQAGIAIIIGPHFFFHSSVCGLSGAYGRT